MHVSVYRTSLQLQIDDYFNSTNKKQLDGKELLAVLIIFSI